DGLCAEVPLLRSLLDGRLVLDRLRDGSVTPEAAQAELHRLWQGSAFAREVFGLLPLKTASAPAPVPEAAPRSSPNVDAILAQVDLGSGATAEGARRDPPPAPVAAESVTNKFSALIAQVVKAGKASAGGIRPTEALARVEKALGVQIGAILQHPEVRRLERAYRGLKLL